MRGNAVDMAAGVVIDAAVGMNVTTIVHDVPMTPPGWLMGGVDFGNLFINPGNESNASPEFRARPQYLRKFRSPPGAATSARRSSTDVDTRA